MSEKYEDSISLQEALKAVQLARARANHAEEEMSRCREAASKLKGKLRRIAIVKSFCEPEKENSNWMQVLGPRELQVQPHQDGEKAQSRRRMSTGCMPDYLQKRCNICSPRIMDFEHIVGHEDLRIFQVLKPKIDACVAGEATEVFGVFVCGTASYDNKASFVDRLAAKVMAQFETAAATAPVAQVQMQMFETHADQHRDLLDLSPSNQTGRQPSGGPAPVVTFEFHPNMEEPMTNSFRKLLCESRSLQSQRFFPVSHFAMSFRIWRPSKPVGQIVIVDVDSSDRGWTCRSSQTHLWHLLGDFQEDFSPTMLLMLDPAPAAQADTMKTLQFGQRLQSSLLRFGPRHIGSADAWHQDAAKDVADPLREELARLQKETSEVLDEVQKMKLQIEKKNKEIAELRKCSVRSKPLQQSPKAQRTPLLQAQAGVKFPKASPPPQPRQPRQPRQPAGSILVPRARTPLPSSRPRLWNSSLSSVIADHPRSQSSKVGGARFLRAPLRQARPQQAYGPDRSDRLGSPMQAMERARLSPPQELRAVSKRCSPKTRLQWPSSRQPVIQKGLSVRSAAISQHSQNGRLPLALIGVEGSALRSWNDPARSPKDVPLMSKAQAANDVEAHALRDSSPSSSSSGSALCSGSWSKTCTRPTARIQDFLPLRLDLTRVFNDVSGFHEGVTPKTPRGRPPTAWWNSEVVAPASARGRAPSSGEDSMDRRARRLYVADLMTPRTALSFMPQGEEKDGVLSPVTLLRPLCEVGCQDEGTRGRPSLGNISDISVSSDEDDIRARLSEELRQRVDKQNDQENRQVFDNVEQALHKEDIQGVQPGQGHLIQAGWCPLANPEHCMHTGRD